MRKPLALADDLGHQGGKAFAKVGEHLRALKAQLGDKTGDALSSTALALGHAALELVGEVEEKLDAVADGARRQIRRHPDEAAATAALAVVLAAGVAGLVTYGLMRRRD